MTIFDVNVLVYAHRVDQVAHDAVRSRLEKWILGGREFALTPLTAGGFVRVVTNPKFPNGPTPPDQALAVIDSLRRNPNARWLNPGERHWEHVSGLCRAMGAVGKAVSDAQHAAIAIEHGAIWASCDGDFLRFASAGLQFDHWLFGTKDARP